MKSAEKATPQKVISFSYCDESFSTYDEGLVDLLKPIVVCFVSTSNDQTICVSF